MKRLMKNIEDIMVSITFAEAGELETARRFMEHEVKENESDEPALPSLLKTA